MSMRSFGLGLIAGGALVGGAVFAAELRMRRIDEKRREESNQRLYQHLDAYHRDQTPAPPRSPNPRKKQ